MAAKTIVLAGKLKKDPDQYRVVSAADAVGARIEAVAGGVVEGQYGPESCTILYLSNGTQVGFVLKSDDDD